MNKIQIQVEGPTVFCIGKHDLPENKKALGRPQDLADIVFLENFCFCLMPCSQKTYAASRE